MGSCSERKPLLSPQTKMDSGKTEESTKSSIMQVVMCSLANTTLLSSGMTLGFTAIALPYMEEPNPLLHVNKEQSSWIASIGALSIPVGCLLSGPLMDRFGRKAALLFSCVPAAAGWLLMAAFPSIISVYIGRVLTGFSTGISSTPATVFIAEGATASLRGLLVCGTSIAISCGVSIVYIMGLFLQSDWRMICVLSGVFPIASFLMTAIWLPESPIWLLGKGRHAQAARALERIRAEPKGSQLVQATLHDFTLRSTSSNKSSLLQSLKSFSAPEAYKPFIIMNLFFLFQQLTGIFVVIFYAVDVVREAGVTMDAFILTVLIGLTRLVFTVIGGWMSRRFGRRLCALISGAGMAVSLITLGVHLLVQAPPSPTLTSPVVNGTAQMSIANPTAGTDLELPPPESGSILPAVAIIVYILTSTIGFLTLPWSMLGEVFPTNVRGLASGLTTCVTYIVSAITVKLYPTMLDCLGKHGVFIFYGAMAVLGTIFVAVYLPETQGKTLAEVEKYFAGKSKKGEINEEEIVSMTKITIMPSAEKEG